MALFSKPALHVRVMAHPAFGWASIALVGLTAAEAVGRTVAGTVQALRERSVKADAAKVTTIASNELQ